MTRAKLAEAVPPSLSELLNGKKETPVPVDLTAAMEEFLGEDVCSRAPTLFKRQAEALVKLRQSLDMQQSQIDILMSNPIALSVGSNAALLNRHRKLTLDYTKATAELTALAIRLGLIDDRKAQRENEKKKAVEEETEDEDVAPRSKIGQPRKILTKGRTVN